MSALKHPRPKVVLSTKACFPDALCLVRGTSQAISSISSSSDSLDSWIGLFCTPSIAILHHDVHKVNVKWEYKNLNGGTKMALQSLFERSERDKPASTSTGNPESSNSKCTANPVVVGKWWTNRLPLSLYIAMFHKPCSINHAPSDWFTQWPCSC